MTFIDTWLLLGREALRLQGLYFADGLLANFTEKFLLNLAGNAFSAPVCGACMLSLLCMDSLINSRRFAACSTRRVARPFAARDMEVDVESSSDDDGLN